MLAMPDSVRVADLPPGYPAYLGYCDGKYVTEPGLDQRFPAAFKVILTVTGRTPDADGVDIEPANLTAKDGAQWARQRINRQPAFRPVLYASVQGTPGYGMGDVLTALAANKIRRAEVRLLSAHWTGLAHICGPRSCSAISEDMDGTQWTSGFRVPGGPLMDMSALRDDFFGNQTEVWVKELGIVRPGDQGPQVCTVQGLCVARGRVLAVDGVFGPKTLYAVETCQHEGGITVDGIVGPQTWPVLLGIA